ncbi:phospholipid carrier-dependent glycosyltransferase [Candidatus Beckwithbacteria bacterium]|nr:phospholipid carrier-dependent glycosyltransferase [Candidatus Beckwithbacteria bacterium]
MKLNILVLIFIIILSAFLRLYHLDTLPPSPYWEEVALGYDAYSILQTGRDHHGQALPILAFESFGDWKPSGYFYVTVPSIALFGLNIWAVRLPSALAGVGTVLLIYLLVKLLLQKHKQKEYIALASALILVIMPWHILVSRVAFETNLALFWTCLGIYFLLFALKSKKIYLLPVSVLPLILSMYTYHSNRVVTPLLVLGLGILFVKKLWQQKIWTVISIVLAFLFVLPIILNFSNPQLNHRLAETSVFTQLEPILESNQAIARHGDTVWAKLLHHRFWYYAKLYLDHYFSHFNPQFLFISGDSNIRHSVGLVGQLYWLQLPLLFLGIYYLFAKKEKNMMLMLWWLVVAPVAAGATKATPHALRALLMVIPLATLCAYGLINFVTAIRKAMPKYILIGSLILLVGGFAFELGQFWYYYTTVYPIKSSQDWQYGYKEMVQFIKEHQNEYDQIIVTRDQGRPAMYYWFYTKTDPKLVQAWENKTPKDQGEFLQFENIYFGIKPQEQGKQLVISSTKMGKQNILKSIVNLEGKPVFYIY